jgi:hypothetical protein
MPGLYASGVYPESSQVLSTSKHRHEMSFLRI